MDQNSPEVITAIQAVTQASALCERIKGDLAVGEFLVKSDRSPVTIADYGSQAIICKLIKDRFPVYRFETTAKNGALILKFTNLPANGIIIWPVQEKEQHRLGLPPSSQRLPATSISSPSVWPDRRA